MWQQKSPVRSIIFALFIMKSACGNKAASIFWKLNCRVVLVIAMAAGNWHQTTNPPIRSNDAMQCLKHKHGEQCGDMFNSIQPQINAVHHGIMWDFTNRPPASRPPAGKNVLAVIYVEHISSFRAYLLLLLNFNHHADNSHCYNQEALCPVWSLTSAITNWWHRTVKWKPGPGWTRLQDVVLGIAPPCQECF